MRISDDPHRFDPGAIVQRADGRPLTIESTRSHGQRMLVKFLDVDDRDAAEALRGPVFVPESALRKLADDEFWHHELIGMAAVDAQGRRLGTVREIVVGAAQELLELDTPAGARLVPFVAEIVNDIDRASRTITLTPPEGLLD
ncbi:MAG: ribosome maturation factor RimM [Actinomycetota bacterium]|nr:ribosome maturation factor RimM [Actinomycetota bacterium]